MKQWYKIENKGDKAEIWIYEEIGEDFWSGDGITAKSFQKDLAIVTSRLRKPTWQNSAARSWIRLMK